MMDPREVEETELSASTRVEGNIEDDPNHPSLVHNIATRMTQVSLDALIKDYPCLEGAVLPTPEQRANSPPPGMVACYSTYFAHCNFRIPPPGFYMRILQHYQIGFARVHPTAMLKIMTFLMVLEALGLRRSVDTFRRFFRVVKSGCWCSLETRQRKWQLIENAPCAVKFWKFYYFFVDASFISRKRKSILEWGPPLVDARLNVDPDSSLVSDEVDRKIRGLRVRHKKCEEGILVRAGISKFWDDGYLPVIFSEKTKKRMKNI